MRKSVVFLLSITFIVIGFVLAWFDFWSPSALCFFSSGYFCGRLKEM